MTIINKREDILLHETPEYINSRPIWEMGQGRVPDLSDYRKISVDNIQEAYVLARLGQMMSTEFIPTIHGKPNRLFFTQALILGASLITREVAEDYKLNFEKYRSVLLICPSRYGKQIARSVKVLTPNGWKCHGDLRIGDCVFHPSGKPVKVMGVKEWPSEHYMVHFDNGQKIECHANHEWVVWNKRKNNGAGKPQGCYETLETKDMADKVLFKDVKGYHPRYYIDPAEPCRFEEKEQPLDPYFVGCWLSRGFKNKPNITLNSEQASCIIPNIPYNVTRIVDHKYYNTYEFDRQHLRKMLKEIGVYSNKHIPEYYKFGSPSQQKALLAGLIDAEGIVNTDGIVTINCRNETLAKDIIELLTIMGLAPHYEKAIVNLISFKPSYSIPTKYLEIKDFDHQRRTAITKIEKVTNPELGSCIQVDSPDGLYLVGESLITTHNSYINAESLLIHAAANGEECHIGSASLPKAQIIQQKIVEMLPNTIEDIQSGLIVDGDAEEDRFKKIKRLSTQVSKDSLKWTNGGSIALFSTNETKKNSDVSAAGAIGIGGDFCVLDEVQLMTPVGFRTASRFMVESRNTKRFCVANPMINGHLKELYDNPNTFVVHINEVTTIIEGRFTRRDIELTDMPPYSQEYRAFIETEFPDANSGTRFFPTMPLPYDQAKLPEPIRKFYFMGIDSAYKGGDSLTVSILSFNESSDKKWFVLEKQFNLKERFKNEWTDRTTLEISLDILKLWGKYNILAGAIDIGYGIHIYEKLRSLEENLPIEPINYSSKPTEWRQENDYNAKYAINKRAELHLDLRDICVNESLYVDGENYDEIVRQMQEIGQAPAKEKIQIEAKKDIKRRLGRSPDNMDSLCLALHACILSGAIDGGRGLSDNDIMETIS